MNTTSLRVVKLALAVQFACVLAVPAIVAAGESPRALWVAEWLRPTASERTIGILTLRDGKLSFDEQRDQIEWDVDLSAIKRIAPEGKGLSITLTSGEKYVVAVMDANLTPASPKKLASALERALQLMPTGNR